MPCPARRLLPLLTLLALAATLLQVAAAMAQPCHLPDLAVAPLQAALARMSRPPLLPPPSPSRWRALLPGRVSLGARQGLSDGLGWSATAGATTTSERMAQSVERAYSVRIDWDLRGLWTVEPARPGPTPADRLQQAANAEQLADKMGKHWKRLRAAQGVALQTVAGDLLCAEALSDAEAAILALQAVLDAARP